MKAVIFDLDGVIVNTDDLHYQAWKKIADREGLYFDPQINARLRGVSRRQSLEIMLEKAPNMYSDREKTALADQKNAVYRELLATLTPKSILPGIPATVKALKNAGLKIAVGSSSKNTALVLEQIGMAAAFDAVSDGNDITHSKPHPEVFLQCAQKLGLAPVDCLVLEDAAAGICAAKAAGMTAAAIGDARTCAEADIVLASPEELCALLLEKTV